MVFFEPADDTAHPDSKLTCGPAQLDKMLTEARAAMAWLREGSSVPQQQIIRDFGKSPRQGPEGHQGPAAHAAACRNAEDQAEA